MSIFTNIILTSSANMYSYKIQSNVAGQLVSPVYREMQTDSVLIPKLFYSSKAPNGSTAKSNFSFASNCGAVQYYPNSIRASSNDKGPKTSREMAQLSSHWPVYYEDAQASTLGLFQSETLWGQWAKAATVHQGFLLAKAACKPSALGVPARRVKCSSSAYTGSLDVSRVRRSTEPLIPAIRAWVNELSSGRGPRGAGASPIGWLVLTSFFFYLPPSD